jgi:hypothetical protein
VAHVEDDPALLGGARRRQQPAVLDDVGEGAGVIGQTGIRMRQDISGAQHVENVRHQLGRLDPADMAHHPSAATGLGCSLDRPPQRLDAVLGDDVFRHADLDPDGDVGILGDRLGAGIDHGVIDVVELRHRKRRQAHIGDVHEGVETRAGLPDDVAAERGEVVGAGIARRHHGGGGLERQQLVRRNADRGAVGVDMGMQVDETGGHELAADIQDLERAIGGNVGLHRLDDAPTNADVAPARVL